MSVISMADLDLAGKRVLVRQDLNVPVQYGEVSSDQRIRASMPTIRRCIESGVRLMIMSHLGRPTDGLAEDQYSLKPVADYLSAALGKNVRLISDYLQKPPVVSDGEVVLLENVAFYLGEIADVVALSMRYDGLFDIYVMYAFV